MALISSKLSNIVPVLVLRAVPLREENETLRCRLCDRIESELIQQLTIRNGHGLTGWGCAEPSAAGQRAAERGLTKRRASPPIGRRCHSRWSVRCVQRAVHWNHLGLSHRAVGLHRRSSPAAGPHF
jgi:hypothetical protein